MSEVKIAHFHFFTHSLVHSLTSPIADNYDHSAHNQFMTTIQTTGLSLFPVPCFSYPPYPPFIYFQNLADYFVAGEEFKTGI
jgi:hypothetical protein